MAINFWDDEHPLVPNQQDSGDRGISNQAITVLEGGRFVVTWRASQAEGDSHFGDSFGAIRARIFNPDGSPDGASFLVNSTTENGPDGASITTLTDGRFVVTWHSHENGDGGTGGNQTIRARVFNADGTPSFYNGSTDDFVVNNLARFEDILPHVAAVPGGGFVITWQSPTAPFGFHDISMRVFTSEGPADGQHAISANDDHSGEPAMTALDDGRYVVGWRSQMGGADDMVARIFNADGTPADVNGSQFTLSTTTQGDQFQLDLATLSDGRFVAVWGTNDSPGGGSSGASDGNGPGIRARVFNADGTADLTVNGGNDFLVNTTTGNEQTRPQVAALANGGFFISYSSKNDPPGNFEDNILGRVFSANGTPEGVDFVLREGPTASGGNYTLPNDALLMPDGRVLAIYKNNPQSLNDINGLFLDFSTSGKNESGDGNDNVMVGTGHADTLNGLGGADSIYAGGGVDILNGGDGTDTLAGGGANDTLNGGSGLDTAAFTGDFNDYQIVRNGSTYTVTGDTGIDTLISIERLRFGDGATVVLHRNDNDFNGDGRSDVLFRQTGDNFDSNYLWVMDNRNLISQGGIELFDKTFTVQIVGDFDGDGKADVLLQNPTTGGVWEWRLDGRTILSEGAVDVGDPSFHMLGTGDFNGDGKDDVLFRGDSGFVFMWQMDGRENTPLPVSLLPPEWRIQGTGDFNGDGRDDILLRNSGGAANENGSFYLWQMNGNQVEAQGGIERPGTDWKTLGIGDFDNDGDYDFAVRNESAGPDNGAVWVYLMNGNVIEAQGAAGIADAATWHLQMIGDLDGDGRDDILFRNDAGYFYSWNMNGTTIGSEGLLQGDAQWADPNVTVVKPQWELV